MPALGLDTFLANGRPMRASTISRRPALLIAALLLGAAGTVGLTATAASAADLTVDQCNNVGPGPAGATTGMTCTVTVVNTISSGTSSSTTTLTRQCSLDACPSGNGTFSSSSTSLVTLINQCNGSDNDAAHPITCRISVTNNISLDTPGAAPVSTATSNQCVGSGGGGGGTVSCSPFPATTSSATVTQCNGSANGGGGTVDCAVDPTSMVAPAIPVRINQCNGTGNAGGTVLNCRATVTTNLVAAPVAAAPSATASPTATPTSTPAPVTSTTTPTPVASSTGAPAVATSPPQVTRIPTGGVAAGGGSTAASIRRGPLAFVGLALLLTGAGVAARRRRSVR